MNTSTATPSRNAINWFEIPCADLDRAQTFYEAVLARPMHREDFGDGPMAVFSHDKPAPGGCLVSGRPVAPDAGIRPYLDCAPSLGAAVARVTAAGGRVIDACIELPHGIGFIAHLHDTEGNLVGLHSTQR